SLPPAGHRGRVLSGGVGEQLPLDPGGGDFLAGAADDVLLAVDEVQHAVAAAVDGIAGVEPAAAPGRLRGRLFLEVAGEAAPPRRRRRMAYQHLAGLAVGNVPAVLVRG